MFFLSPISYLHIFSRHFITYLTQFQTLLESTIRTSTIFMGVIQMKSIVHLWQIVLENHMVYPSSQVLSMLRMLTRPLSAQNARSPKFCIPRTSWNLQIRSPCNYSCGSVLSDIEDESTLEKSARTSGKSICPCQFAVWGQNWNTLLFFRFFYPCVHSLWWSRQHCFRGERDSPNLEILHR